MNRANLSPNWNSFVSINTYNERGVVTKVEDGTGHAWWSCDETDFDAKGHLLQYTQGNGVVTTNAYNALTGRIEGIGLTGLTSGLHTQGFGYDRLGNLTQRSLSRTMQSTLSETCGYDSLNRLLTASTGSTTSTVVYDSIGNITAKDGITDYAYGAYNAGPHAVTTANGISHLYDDCGNLINRTEGGSNTTAIAWTSFNKPSRIDMDASNVTSTNYSEFAYDANHNRTTQTIRNGGNLTKKLYLAGFEQTEISTNLVVPAWTHTETRVFVATPVGTIGILVQDALENTERRYLHKDHLGSVVAITGEPTSGDAPVLGEYSFDAWGTHRDPSDWSPSTSNQQPSTSLSSDRGFTGHEMLDHLGLVHMNGRIFDSRLGRFLSPDPLIQAPENLQSFNRFSYVFNNPLTHTDPSGFKTASKKASSEAATNSTKLGAPIETNENTASQDNIGGSQTESSKQVDDYYTDGNGNTQVDSVNSATEHLAGDTNGNPAFNQTPPTDLSAYGLASKEFMETGIDPSEGTHDKFAAKKGTPTEQYTEGGQVPDATATYAYQGGGNNTVSRATGADPNYVPPSNYQPPVISAARPGSRKAPEIQPMSANEFFQTQNLTLGAPVSDPMMANINATMLVIGLSPYAAQAAAPVLEGVAAPVTTWFLQNAPQINQATTDFLQGMYDSPSVPSSGSGAIGVTIGGFTTWQENR